MDYSGYGGVPLSMLGPTYNILSNILLSRLIPYVDTSSGDRQCGFVRYGSTTDHVCTYNVRIR
jgi:hypothetical protein